MCRVSRPCLARTHLKRSEVIVVRGTAPQNYNPNFHPKQGKYFLERKGAAIAVRIGISPDVKVA